MSDECPACGSTDCTCDGDYREAVQYMNHNWIIDPQKIDKRFDVVFNGDYEHKSEAYDTFRKNIQQHLKIVRKHLETEESIREKLELLQYYHKEWLEKKENER